MPSLTDISGSERRSRPLRSTFETGRMPMLLWAKSSRFLVIGRKHGGPPAPEADFPPPLSAQCAMGLFHLWIGG